MGRKDRKEHFRKRRAKEQIIVYWCLLKHHPPPTPTPYSPSSPGDGDSPSIEKLIPAKTAQSMGKSIFTESPCEFHLSSTHRTYMKRQFLYFYSSRREGPGWSDTAVYASASGIPHTAGSFPGLDHGPASWENRDQSPKDTQWTHF
jgi:hypothetical protein